MSKRSLPEDKLLKYSGRNLSDEDLEEIPLEDELEYEEVDFSMNGLSDDGLKKVLEICGRCRKLRILKLFKNNIGDVGAEEIAKFVRKSRTIEEIHLSHNRFTEKGVVSIVEAGLEDRPKELNPLWLRLEYNDVKDQHACAEDLTSRLSVCRKTAYKQCTVQHCKFGKRCHIPHFEKQGGEPLGKGGKGGRRWSDNQWEERHNRRRGDYEEEYDQRNDSVSLRERAPDAPKLNAGFKAGFLAKSLAGLGEVKSFRKDGKSASPPQSVVRAAFGGAPPKENSGQGKGIVLKEGGGRSRSPRDSVVLREGPGREPRNSLRERDREPERGDRSPVPRGGRKGEPRHRSQSFQRRDARDRDFRPPPRDMQRRDQPRSRSPRIPRGRDIRDTRDGPRRNNRDAHEPRIREGRDVREARDLPRRDPGRDGNGVDEDRRPARRRRTSQIEEEQRGPPREGQRRRRRTRVDDDIDSFDEPEPPRRPPAGNADAGGEPRSRLGRDEEVPRGRRHRAQDAVNDAPTRSRRLLDANGEIEREPRPSTNRKVLDESRDVKERVVERPPPGPADDSSEYSKSQSPPRPSARAAAAPIAAKTPVKTDEGRARAAAAAVAAMSESYSLSPPPPVSHQPKRSAADMAAVAAKARAVAETKEKAHDPRRAPASRMSVTQRLIEAGRAGASAVHMARAKAPARKPVPVPTTQGRKPEVAPAPAAGFEDEYSYDYSEDEYSYEDEPAPGQTLQGRP